MNILPSFFAIFIAKIALMASKTTLFFKKFPGGLAPIARYQGQARNQGGGDKGRDPPMKFVPEKIRWWAILFQKKIACGGLKLIVRANSQKFSPAAGRVLSYLVEICKQ